MQDKQRILIVDDVPSNLKMLNEILRGEYNISVATSGAEALRLIAATPPDLILLDIMMPEMDGYEVCKKLKEDKTTMDIPVVFVTAMGEVEDETKGLNMGAADFITKPISPPIVLARVKNLLKMKDQHDQLKSSISILEHEAEILQQKASLGIQAGGLAHDINNVLAACMIIELIPSMLPSDDFKNKSDLLEFLGCAMDNLRLGREICQGYTSFIRNLDQGEMVQPILPLLQPLDMYSRKFRGEIIRQFDENIPAIKCKGNQIKRVVVNLFANAMQALEGQAEQRVVARLWSDKSRVFFSMQDNGPGIPEDVMPNIFNENFTTKKTGTGLGLSMCKTIMEGHNGNIEAVSSPGEGATFIISFPAAEEMS